jgi:hypothetical protein
MIRLLLFAPCEKLLYTEESGNSSLISILESIIVSGAITEELQPNAGLPMKWVGVCLWNRTEELEEPVDFDAKIDLIAPNGEAVIGGTVKFTISNDYANFRNTINFPIIPIGQSGVYSLKLNYKKSVSEEWEQAGEFPLQIIHNFTEIKNENQIEDQIGASQPAE